MSKQQNLPPDRNERMSRELHRELGKQGWRIPQSDQEVRAAEDWVSKNPVRLPERLLGGPEKASSPEPGSLLSRYLRDAERDLSERDELERDDRSDREFERD